MVIDCRPDQAPVFHWWPKITVGKVTKTGTCNDGVCMGVNGPVTRVDVYPVSSVDCDVPG